jgi:hypothetical protein
MVDMVINAYFSICTYEFLYNLLRKYNNIEYWTKEIQSYLHPSQQITIIIINYDIERIKSILTYIYICMHWSFIDVDKFSKCKIDCIFWISKSCILLCTYIHKQTEKFLILYRNNTSISLYVYDSPKKICTYNSWVLLLSPFYFWMLSLLFDMN